MSDCNFTINFSGPANAVVTNVQSQIQQQGGNFDGDENAGSFSLKVMGSNIEGSYVVSGSQLNVTITDKPFFLGCGQIESFLKSRVGG